MSDYKSKDKVFASLALMLVMLLLTVIVGFYIGGPLKGADRVTLDTMIVFLVILAISSVVSVVWFVRTLYETRC